MTTSQISLGSGTLNLPNSHPAQVAAHVSMIDHMLEGRFILGIGPGGLRSDWEVFGNLDADRNAMFVECIDQILAIWARDAPYDLEGSFWNISHAPHPPARGRPGRRSSSPIRNRTRRSSSR